MIETGSIVRLTHDREFGPKVASFVAKAGTVLMVVDLTTEHPSTELLAPVYRLDLLFPDGSVRLGFMTWFAAEVAFDEVFVHENETIKHSQKQ